MADTGQVVAHNPQPMQRSASTRARGRLPFPTPVPSTAAVPATAPAPAAGRDATAFTTSMWTAPMGQRLTQLRHPVQRSVFTTAE